MNILAIESSCDETAAAIISGDPADPTSTPTILSNVVVSQIDIFKAYGGVIPEIAARSHLEAILPVIHQAFADAHLITDDHDDWNQIDAIAVTHTPGLLGSLLIGTLTARTLAILHNKPLYAIHHLKSHVYANWLIDNEKSNAGKFREHCEKPTVISTNAHGKNLVGSPACQVRSKFFPPERCGNDDGATSSSLNFPALDFPLLALVVSGGHTQILYIPHHNDFQIIGTTRDDAVGECFDKIAKILGLPYPGGPAIAAAVQHGNPTKYKFPHPQVPGLDFSFSGLKTAVLRTVQHELNLPVNHPSHDLHNHLTSQQVADFAASFQATAIDILIEKLRLALNQHPGTRSILLAGGVSANQLLREKLQNTFEGHPQLRRGRSDEARNDRPLGRGTQYGPEERPEKVFLAFPDIKFSGDNAAMVGAAAFYEIASGIQPTDPYHLNISPRSPIS